MLSLNAEVELWLGDQVLVELLWHLGPGTEMYFLWWWCWCLRCRPVSISCGTRVCICGTQGSGPGLVCVCVCVCMLGRPALAQAWDHRVQQCLWPRGGAGCSSRRPWEWWVRVPTLVPQRVELEIVAAWLCWLEVNATTSWGRSQNPGGGHRATTVQPSDGRTKQWLTTPGAGHREALVPSPTCVMTNQSHN